MSKKPFSANDVVLTSTQKMPQNLPSLVTSRLNEVCHWYLQIPDPVHELQADLALALATHAGDDHPALVLT